MNMKRVVQVFRSFEEAERANDAYYAALTPTERLQILAEINRAFWNDDDRPAEGFPRVCRIVERRRC